MHIYGNIRNLPNLPLSLRLGVFLRIRWKVQAQHVFKPYFAVFGAKSIFSI